MPPQPYKNQHYISKVLQQRFAESGHVSHVRRSQADEVKHVGLNKSFAEPWWIRDDPARFEELWSDAESVMPAAFAELDSSDHKLPVGDDSAGSIKDFMALHLVRSPAIAEFWSRGRTNVVPKRRAALLADGALIAHGRSSGCFPDTASDEDILDAVTAKLTDPLGDGRLAFAESVVETYEEVRDWMRSWHLELAFAEEEEFLLPDVPCVPYNVRARQAGLLAGFGLHRTDFFSMPLGPRHVVSLVKAERSAPWLLLTAEQVASTNRAHATAAMRAVCFRPGSGLETQVRDAWRSQGKEPGHGPVEEDADTSSSPGTSQ